MTRKDYILIARALSGAMPVSPESDRVKEAWSTAVDALAYALASDNARFDRERFLRACRGQP